MNLKTMRENKKNNKMFLLLILIFSFFTALSFISYVTGNKSQASLEWASIIYSIVIIAISLYTRQFNEYIKEKSKKETNNKLLKLIQFLAVVLVASFTMALFCAMIDVVLKRFGYSILDSNISMMNYCKTWRSFLYVIILGPLTEEIIFRGYIFKALSKYNQNTGIFISAILFGLYHGYFCQIIAMTIVGLIFGYIRINYSMKWCIITHMFYNLLVGEIIGYSFHKLNILDNDFMFTVIIECMFIISMIVLFISRKEITEGLEKLKQKDKREISAILKNKYAFIFIIMCLAEAVIMIKKI